MANTSNPMGRFGKQADIYMALAVIGGLVTSTILTLVVIPCLYYVFDKMGRDK